MRLPGLKTLKRAGRILRSRLISGALILGYHRVAELPCDPFDISVDTDLFTEQMDVVSSKANPIRLMDLVRFLRNNELPKNSVVITFDDGYSDVLFNAKPILEKYGIPATVFITTGNIGQEFWWDELYRMIIKTSGLENELSLSKDLAGHEWKFTRHPNEEDEAYRERLHNSLHKLISGLQIEARKKIMMQIKDWVGIERSSTPDVRCLTGSEITQLAGSGLFDIGSHLDDHITLSLLSAEEKMQRLRRSKLMLEEMLCTPVQSFSYPTGINTEADQEAVRIVGYECACSSYNDIVRERTNLFQLPRFWLSDLDGRQTHLLLRQWLLH
jgi:peptidoglycan/xylan/chitin deacetylase (PgdA/CDA1 family)